MLLYQRTRAAITECISCDTSETFDTEQATAAANNLVVTTSPAAAMRMELLFRARLAAVHTKGGLHISSRYVMMIKGVIDMEGTPGVPDLVMLPVSNDASLRYDPMDAYPLGAVNARVAASREVGMSSPTWLIGERLRSIRSKMTVAMTALFLLSLVIARLRLREGLWGRGVLTLPSRLLLTRTDDAATSDMAAAPARD